MQPKRTFILGGARSGKSRFAESLVVANGGARVYVATAQAFDEEMKARIAAHKSRRGDGWRDVEAPVEVSTALAEAKRDETVLLDCATLWLSNQMLAGKDPDLASSDFLRAVSDCPAKIVVVSNEVGQGIVPENALGRAFRDAQGALNQSLAEWSDLAVLVSAGLPLVLKGKLP